MYQLFLLFLVNPFNLWSNIQRWSAGLTFRSPFSGEVKKILILFVYIDQQV